MVDQTENCAKFQEQNGFLEDALQQANDILEDANYFMDKRLVQQPL